MPPGESEDSTESTSATDGAGTESTVLPGARPYLWMLLAAVAFAGMAAFARALDPLLDWRLIASARSGLALVFAAILVRRAGGRLVWSPGTLWLRSIAGSVSMACTFYGLSELQIAEVLTISNVFPVWVALLSWPLLGEIPSLSVWFAIALGLTGVALVEQPHWIDGNTAAMVVLAGSFFTAIAMLGLHRLKEVDPRAIVVHFSGVAFLTCCALVIHAGRAPFEESIFNAQVFALLIGLGISATIGQVFLTKAFAAGPPAKVSVVALSQVAIALCLDVVLWQHRFSQWSLLGMALVVTPTVWLMLSQGAPAVAHPKLEK